MIRSFTAHRREITALRLTTQAIAQPHEPAAVAGPGATVRRLLAVQAQDFAGAKYSVGLRTPGSTDASIEAALAARELVRSWPMRGTLHFVPPEDLGWMLSVTAERTIRSSAGRHRALELTENELHEARAVAIAELSGGRTLTREDLLARFVAAGIPVAGQRGVHILQRLSLWRVIVFAQVEGKKHTFALLDDWVTAPRVLERDEALGEFAARYFLGHGPATLRDFAWWASLTLADARTGLALARPGLDELTIDDVAYYLPRDTTAASSGIHALPGFDEYLLGYQDRSAPLAADHAALVVPGANGLFLPTIVVDGEIVGTWRRTTATTGITIEPHPFSPLAARASTGFSAAAADYARFVGRPLVPAGA